jgi:catalase
MHDPAPPHTPPRRIGAWSLIIGVVAIVAVAFGYVGGWLAPLRLTPKKLVNQLQHDAGTFAGYRRNHAKGVCVVGHFDSSGQAQTYSVAQVFAAGQHTPVVGRFAIPGGNPYAPDSSVPIRSMALRFTLANGQQWRTGMNSMPVFPVATPQAFYAQLQAKQPDPVTGKPDPAKIAAFFAAHPETAAFRTWAKTAKPSASFATESYWGLNAFVFVDAAGRRQPVRWSVTPLARDAAGATAPEGADFLEKDLVQRLAEGPLRWQLNITLANPGDPVNDASKTWPDGRKVINAGTLVLEKTQPQLSGECRDINYDPLVLPAGIEGSDDPLLAARSAGYADSYLRRTSEVGQLPAAKQEARP